MVHLTAMAGMARVFVRARERVLVDSHIVTRLCVYRSECSSVLNKVVVERLISGHLKMWIACIARVRGG